MRLNREEDLVQWSEDLIDFSDGRLVLEVDGCIEVGNFHVDGFADHFALGCVQEAAHFVDLVWRSVGLLETPSATACAASESTATAAVSTSSAERHFRSSFCRLPLIRSTLLSACASNAQI